MYIFVSALADFNLKILIPAAIGAAIGALAVSFLMSLLIKKYYTVTFSIIFGLFISIIPGVMNSSCVPDLSLGTAISFILVPIGFLISFYLGDIERNNERIKRLFKKKGCSERKAENNRSGE